MNKTLSLTALSGLLIGGFASAGLGQTVVYDNLSHASFPYYYPSSKQFADDTTLTMTGMIDEVDFGMYTPTAINDTVVLDFYNIDPGTGYPMTAANNPAYSATFSLSVGSGGWTVGLTLGTLFNATTTNLATSITFLNAAGGIDTNPGLLLGNTPVVGSSNDYFFQNDGGVTNNGWGAYYFGGNPPANFAIEIKEQQSVPEPSAFVALGLGAIGLISRRRK